MALNKVSIDCQDVSGSITQGDVSRCVKDIGCGLRAVQALWQLNDDASVVQLAVVLNDVGLIHLDVDAFLMSL
jgi:hypothetical protein